MDSSASPHLVFQFRTAMATCGKQNLKPTCALKQPLIVKSYDAPAASRDQPGSAWLAQHAPNGLVMFVILN